MTQKQYFNDIKVKKGNHYCICMFCEEEADFVIEKETDEKIEIAMCKKCARLFKNKIDIGLSIYKEKKFFTMEDIDLLSLDAGDIFIINDIKYIILEQLDKNRTVVLSKELLDYTMNFDDDNNIWETSDTRNYLNDLYLAEVESIFGKHRIIPHAIGSLNIDSFNKDENADKISLLSVDLYKKYRRLLRKSCDDMWWLINYKSMRHGCHFYIDYCVTSDDILGQNDCFWFGRGARPFFIIQS